MAFLQTSIGNIVELLTAIDKAGTQTTKTLTTYTETMGHLDTSLVTLDTSLDTLDEFLTILDEEAAAAAALALLDSGEL